MESICTLCTIKNVKDLKLLLKSLELIGNKRPIYILCDVATYEQFKNKPNLHFIAILQVPNQSRSNMVKNNIWTDFMLKKCDVIDEALRHHSSTLFVDSDVVFLSDFDLHIKNNSILLSPHFIKNEDENKYGKYNGGYIGVADKNFTSWWRNAARNSKFMEQECLTQAVNIFSCGEINIQHNFGWWRLFQNENIDFRKKLFTSGSSLCYDNLPLASVHSHFFSIENLGAYIEYNIFILELLKKSFKPEHQELLSFINIKQGYLRFFYYVYSKFLIGRRHMSKYLTIFAHKYL